MQYLGAGERACVDNIRLCSREGRGYDDLAAVQIDIEAQVMAVEGPTPGLIGGWDTEEEEVVGVLVHDFWDGADFAKEMVDGHRCPGLFIALGREGGGENRKDGCCDGGVEFFEAQPEGAEEEFGVGPCTPFFRVERVRNLLLLRWSELVEHFFYGCND